MFTNSICSQHYQVVNHLSTVKFYIKNFGLTVEGSFTGLKGDIKFNATDLSNAAFNTSIEVNSIQTGNEARDKHLRKEEYFNVSKYPTSTFVSKQILKTEVPDTYLMIATISLKGITKEVRFPFMAKMQRDGMLFSGEFTLNRRDFSIGSSSFVLSEKLSVKLSAFAKKEKD